MRRVAPHENLLKCIWTKWGKNFKLNPVRFGVENPEVELPINSQMCYLERNGSVAVRGVLDNSVTLIGS